MQEAAQMIWKNTWGLSEGKDCLVREPLKVISTVCLKSDAFSEVAISEGRQNTLNNRKKSFFGTSCSVLRQVAPQLSRVRGQLRL